MRLAKLICISTVVFWGLVGIFAMNNYHRADENLVLDAFISICSLSLLVSVLLIEHLSSFRTTNLPSGSDLPR